MRWFASFRGWPKRVHSDRGTQLVAVSMELNEAVKELNWSALQEHGIQHTLEWSFYPVDAPWMNGVTEALVKSIKEAPDAAVGDQIMGFSELQTVRYEAAQIVNQRPIGKHPTYSDVGSFVCPNDLLLGRSSPEIPQGPLKQRASDRYKLDLFQQVVQNFWKKWTRDYFPGLIARSKWYVEKRNVEKGDVVLIQDSNPVGDNWKIGIVSEVHPSQDNKVRRVTLSYKTQHRSGTPARYPSIERAVHKLIGLVPVDQEA